MSESALELIAQLATVRDEELVGITTSPAARALCEHIISTDLEDFEVAPEADLLHRTFEDDGLHARLASSMRGQGWRGKTAPPRIAAAVLLVIAVGTLVAVSTNGHQRQQIFPNVPPSTATTPSISNVPWHLADVLSQTNLAEGQLPSAASMLSCATTEQCYAISNPPIRRFSQAPDYLMSVGTGELDVSSNVGSSWSTAPLPSGVMLTTPLVCETSTDCAAGALLLGQPQSVQQLAPADGVEILEQFEQNPYCPVDTMSETQLLAALANFAQVAGAEFSNNCALNIASIVSLAMSRTGSTSENSASNFGLVPHGSLLAALEQTIDSMSVYSATTTTAALEVTTDGGQSWNQESLPSGTGPVISLACPSVSTCMGLAWKNTNIAPDEVLPGTSTRTGDQFVPVSFLETSDDGSTWTTSSFPDVNDTPVSLSCSSTSSCLAVGIYGQDAVSSAHSALVLQTTDGGNSWAAASLPGGLGDVTEATCPSATACYAIGDPQHGFGVVLSSGDGGVTWVKLSLPAGLANPPLTSISCPSATDCSVSGSVAFRVSSGTGPAPADDSVSGPHGTFNATNGPNSGPAMIISTHDAGSTWQVETFGWAEANSNELLETSDVECFVSTSCLAIGGSSSLATPVLVGST